MKCIVTGAAGFIGSHLCERLISDGHSVIGIDNLVNGKRSNLDKIIDHGNFHFLVEDIRTTPSPAYTGIDWVFHLAALADVVPSIENPMEYHNVNVTGTMHVLEAARRGDVKKFIYAASSSCYGIPNECPTSESAALSPEYPYAHTKLMGELSVHHWRRVYGLDAVALRLFNVYGPRHRTSGTYGAVFGVFLSQLAHGAPLTIVGDGEQSRDFTYVTDVVDAFIKAASNEGFTCMNVGTGKPHSVNELAALLGGPNVDVVHLPDRPGEPRITHANIDVITDRLGWKPKVSFEEGVSKMKELIPEYKDAPLWTKDTIAKATESWFKHLAAE